MPQTGLRCEEAFCCGLIYSYCLDVIRLWLGIQIERWRDPTSRKLRRTHGWIAGWLNGQMAEWLVAELFNCLIAEKAQAPRPEA